MLCADIPVAKREALPAGDVVSRDFFRRPSDEVAADLVGKLVWRTGIGGGRLTEVEAYLPVDDPACHAAAGPTVRNAAMFGPPGCLYVFLSYGIHTMLNLVCDREALGSAVLVRAFEPLGDTAKLAACRAGMHSEGDLHVDEVDVKHSQGPVRGPWLSCGPGRVGQALGIRLDMSGLELGPPSGVYVLDDGERPEVMRTTRVGISRGTSLPLRFYSAGSGYVSQIGRTSGGLRA